MEYDCPCGDSYPLSERWLVGIVPTVSTGYQVNQMENQPKVVGVKSRIIKAGHLRQLCKEGRIQETVEQIEVEI